MHLVDLHAGGIVRKPQFGHGAKLGKPCGGIVGALEAADDDVAHLVFAQDRQRFWRARRRVRALNVVDALLDHAHVAGTLLALVHVPAKDGR